MDTLTAKQAAQKWELSTYQVKRICKNMGINPGAIPADLKPVYVPDKRYAKDPHRFYIFILDVVANTHLELEPLDAIETYVERLRDAGLIVLKKGRASDSLDYHDYIITEDRELFYNWMNCKMKQKIEMIGSLIPDLSVGA